MKKSVVAVGVVGAAGVAGLVLSSFAVSVAQADTIVKERIAATQRLVPLSKLTVGPDDQYQGVRDPLSGALVFTRKSELAPHLCVQDPKSGEVKDLVEATSDSQDPAFSADGKLAFTYFKFHASGDVCYKTGLYSEEIHCLPSGGEGERSSPFWKSPRELGYVLRNPSRQVSQIVLEDVTSGKKEVLAEGVVWSPSITPDGSILIYNQMNEKARLLMMKDLKTGKSRVISWNLPGISGLPAVSKDGKYLYFSHYLNDTNNDSVIDGNDNSVLFRMPLELIRSAPESSMLFPEQLTSVGSNCSFPHPPQGELGAQGETILATCASGGSLDIYEIPAGGVVPKAWDLARLRNAIQTSRTYQDRILLLNTIKYRFGKDGARSIEERLLSNHLMADDMSAAKFYARGLEKASEDLGRHDFFGLLRLFLEAREKKKTQPSNEVTRVFHEELVAIEKRMEAFRSQPRLKGIIQGLLRSYLDQPKESASFLKKSGDRPSDSTLEEFLYFELARWTYGRLGAQADLYGAYRRMFTLASLSGESRLYYADEFLELVKKAEKDLSRRQEILKKAALGLSGPVADLFKSELASLSVVQAAGDAAKAQAYRDLDALMSSTRGDYFLRKTLYVRAILNFADAEEFKYLNYVATNWLRFTDASDTEFAYAREIYAGTSLERAYDNEAKGRLEFAGNFFYGSLSLTDDLESHEGYVRVMNARGSRKTLTERYQNLKERKFIDDNMKFVNALLKLVDSEDLDGAMDELLAMEQDRDNAVRHLVLGSCYLQKMLKGASGYDFDLGLFEKAHRSLMLAYDLGRDNVRVQAAALADLGVLHQRAQNHGLSARFLAKRKELGFLNVGERERLTWLYARALFFTDQPDRAAEELGELLGTKETLPHRAALEERHAFYLQAAGRFEEAAQGYASLFKKGTITGETNLSRANLAYGYSLFKSKREKEAQTALRAGLTPNASLRVRLIAWGLLAQLGTPAERLAALEKREALLPEAKGMLDDWSMVAIQNQLQLARAVEKSDRVRAQKHLGRALEMAESFGDSNHYLGSGIYHAAADFLAYGILHRDLKAEDSGKRIRGVVEKILRAYDKQKGVQAFLDFQYLKLELLRDAYFREGRKATILESERAKRLRDAEPELAKQVGALADGMGR